MYARVAINECACDVTSLCRCPMNLLYSSAMQHQTVSIVGGGGFLGRAIVAQLAPRVSQLRVISRSPHPSLFSQYKNVSCVPANALRGDSISNALKVSIHHSCDVRVFMWDKIAHRS